MFCHPTYGLSARHKKEAGICERNKLKSKVNVKDYDEMKKGLVTRNRNLLFYFDGKDEKAAEGRIEMLFQP